MLQWLDYFDSEQRHFELFSHEKLKFNRRWVETERKMKQNPCLFS